MIDTRKALSANAAQRAGECRNAVGARRHIGRPDGIVGVRVSVRATGLLLMNGLLNVRKPGTIALRSARTFWYSGTRPKHGPCGKGKGEA